MRLLSVCPSSSHSLIAVLKGATIKKDKSSGAIVVARIMRGGAADKSGELINSMSGCYDGAYKCYRDEHVAHISICISNTLKAWSMKGMSWKRWTESRWNTGNQRKSSLFWLVSHCFLKRLLVGCFCFSFSPLALNFFSLAGIVLHFSYCQQISWKKANKASVCLSVPFNFSTMSVALSSIPRLILLKLKTFFFFFLNLSNFLKQLGTVVFSKRYSNKSKQCIRVGLFPAAD